MGEISDMIVNGDLCEICGDYLGEGDGYPRKCSYCQGREERKKRIRKSKNKENHENS